MWENPAISWRGGFSRLSLESARVPKPIGLLCIVALHAGCGDPTSTTAGWLTARIEQQAVSAEPSITYSEDTVEYYEGTAEFWFDRNPGYGVDIAFVVHSRGTGPSLGEWLLLAREGAGRPGRDWYRLGPLELKNGRLQGFTAFYVRETGVRLESYTALSGEVVITESSSDRVAGVFQFTGVMYCWRSDVDGWCTSPITITPGAPGIKVTGRFSAVPEKPVVDSVMLPR